MEYKCIANTQYIITRVFESNKTASDLIEERVKTNYSSSLSLTDGDKMMYNDNSGSIQSKEAI